MTDRILLFGRGMASDVFTDLPDIKKGVSWFDMQKAKSGVKLRHSDLGYSDELATQILFVRLESTARRLVQGLSPDRSLNELVAAFLHRKARINGIDYIHESDRFEARFDSTPRVMPFGAVSAGMNMWSVHGVNELPQNQRMIPPKAKPEMSPLTKSLLISGVIGAAAVVLQARRLRRRSHARRRTVG